MLGRAWQALVIRFITTCSSCCVFPRTGGRFSARSTVKFDVDRFTRFPTIKVAESMTVLRSTDSSSPPASALTKSFKLCTIRLIRCDPSSIPIKRDSSSAFISSYGNPPRTKFSLRPACSSRIGKNSDQIRASTSAFSIMRLLGLLISCATPDTRIPRLVILSA